MRYFSAIAAGMFCLFVTSSTGDAATIYACKKKVGGALRIVKDTTVCASSEKKTSWPDAAEFATLQQQVADLQALLQHFSRNGDDISITGANLRITSGSGTTDGTVNGLGNLVVGYNELRVTGDDRTGSHNIVVGDRLNYSSYGGLVAGSWNTISAMFATVSGGGGNTASGAYSSVSGGGLNTASGQNSSISGGTENHANGQDSSVSGGAANHAAGQKSSVSGGAANYANGENSAVSGGYERNVPGIHDWAAGGLSQDQ